MDLPPSSLLDPLNIPPYNPPNDPPKLPFPHALSILIKSTFPPSLSPHPGVWCFDDKVVCIYDRYNKSSTHFLVIPRDGRIKDVEDLTADDRGIINYMSEVCNRLIPISLSSSSSPTPLPPLPPLLGFHSTPSLNPLHLHCIPTGIICGSHVKKYQHVSSFLSDFFVPLDTISQFLDNGLLGGKKKVVISSLGPSFDSKMVPCSGCNWSKSGRGAFKDWLEHQRSCEVLCGERAAPPRPRWNGTLLWEGTETHVSRVKEAEVKNEPYRGVKRARDS